MTVKVDWVTFMIAASDKYLTDVERNKVGRAFLQQPERVAVLISAYGGRKLTEREGASIALVIAHRVLTEQGGAS